MYQNQHFLRQFQTEIITFKIENEKFNHVNGDRERKVEQ